ncbi:MAG: NrdH-redoxin, partial [Planctomycetes bacterium]|nr:NrdH-redoxin [Planctomycetota bacterium]
MVDIKIYTTPTCPYCLKAKDYFKKKGVQYKEYNVAQDK